MSVVLPHSLPVHLMGREPLVVLCGDIHQRDLTSQICCLMFTSIAVGPVIPSQEARDCELDISLLERLFQRDVYAAHPLARTNLNKATQLLARTLAQSYRPPFVNLVKVSLILLSSDSTSEIIKKNTELSIYHTYLDDTRCPIL